MSDLYSAYLSLVILGVLCDEVIEFVVLNDVDVDGVGVGANWVEHDCMMWPVGVDVDVKCTIFAREPLMVVTCVHVIASSVAC